MLKRLAFVIAATSAVVVPASGAFAATPRTTGVLPQEFCFAIYPAPVQSLLCGQGAGGPGGR